MFGFQTLSCLQGIPVVRSSTNKLQDVYAKAKDTSALIRLPLNLVETIADKSLKIALTIVNPLVKPLYGPVRVIDDYAAQKIRQIESKYPVINTPTEDVVNTFNEKTEPVRNVMNTVKDTTTSTIQHGKETVSNVATATVNKASGVADSVFSFCQAHVPGVQRHTAGKSTGLNGFVFSTVDSLLNNIFQSVQSSVIWFRMLVVFFLLKTKQINDLVLNKLQQKPFLTALPQRLLIIVAAFLDRFIGQIKPTDRQLAELKKSKQQPRLNQQPPFFVNRVKPNPSVTTRQNIVVTKQETVISRNNDSNIVSQSLSQPDYSNLTDREELHLRLANGDNDTYTTESVDLVTNGDIDELHAHFNPSGDIDELHAHLNPTDVELLYARLPSGTLPVTDNQGPLNEDQQQLHARVIGAELERQGYSVDDE
jgi:hypothetical protein